MEKITEDFITSYEERLKSLKEITGEAKAARDNTRTLLHNFRTSRQQEGTKLVQELSREKRELALEAKQRHFDTGKLVGNLKERRRDGAAQEKARREEATSGRKSEVKKILGTTAETIKGLSASRQETKKRMHHEMSESRAAARSDTSKIREAAREMVNGFNNSRKERGDQLKKDLAGNREKRQADLREMRQGFARTRADVHASRTEDAAAWREMEDVIKGRKGGLKEVAKTGKEKAAWAGAETAPNLEARMLARIVEHPNGGVTLTEIAESLGVVPIVLGRAAKSLIEKGKIRKEDKLYFPAMN